MKAEEKEIKQFIKKGIENRKKRKYTLFLPAEYEDDRTIEFTQGEVDDIINKLESQPERKFSISLPQEYVEILNDIAKRDTKRWNLTKVTRTRDSVINEAIQKYIKERGYIVTKEWLYSFQELHELTPLMALCKNAQKIEDFPDWVRGWWVKNDPSIGYAEYLGNDSDEEVDKWFLKAFAEIREEQEQKKSKKDVKKQ